MFLFDICNETDPQRRRGCVMIGNRMSFMHVAINQLASGVSSAEFAYILGNLENTDEPMSLF